MLSVDNLNIGYKDRREVLHNLGFNLGNGEILAILGPNGVGKTTLLRCINGIIKPWSGTVMVEGIDVSLITIGEVAKHLSYVAQHNEPLRITAFDAILLGRKPHLRWRVTNEDLSKVDSVLNSLGLKHLALRYINEMSGGELQKVSIARALVQEPKVLLLDEPTSSLDLKNQLDILGTIRRSVKEHGISAVMTMHDLNLALRFSDRFILLKEGRIYGSGKTEDIDAQMIESVYGVKVDIIDHEGRIVIIPKD
jgi:iron complex transport system ATP-binding protein